MNWTPFALALLLLAGCAGPAGNEANEAAGTQEQGPGTEPGSSVSEGGDTLDDAPEMTYIFDRDDEDGVGGEVAITGWTGPQDALADDLGVTGTALPHCTIPWQDGQKIKESVVGATVDCADATEGQAFLVVWRPTHTVALRKEF